MCISTCSSHHTQSGNETTTRVLHEENRHIVWRLNKAIYSLRSSPKQMQDHITHVLTVTLELVRYTTESNVYRSKDCLVYIMIYVDDLLFIGVQSIINTLFSRIQKEVLLRHTGDLTVGSTIHFLGRNISHRGDHIDISLNNNYVEIILEESGTMASIHTTRHQLWNKRASKIITSTNAV